MRFRTQKDWTSIPIPLFFLSYILLIIPLVSTFGTGIHAGSTTTPIGSNGQSSSSPSGIGLPRSGIVSPPPSTADKLNVHHGGSSSGSKTVLSMSKKGIEEDEINQDNQQLKKRMILPHLLQKWKSKRNNNHHSNTSYNEVPTDDPNDTTISEIKSTTQLKGENQSSFLSRILYLYVSPLLHRSTQRSIQQSDAFPVTDSYKMNTSVPQLSQIYSRQRSKAKKKLELIKSSTTSNTMLLNGGRSEQRQFKKRINEKIAKSESLILAKSLLLFQKRNLLLTACLRLLNTSIQAFPAILVSRILRLLEAGKTLPPSQSVQAALSLVALLSVKMLVENQYFHFVVKYATLVRGSIAGLIFDKSLKCMNVGSIGGLDTASTTSSSSGSNDEGSSEDGSKSNSGKSDETKKKEKSQMMGVGAVLNLMQSDAAIIESAAMQIHTLWDGLLQIIIYSTLLYKFLGPPVFWGIGVLISAIPLNSVFLRVLNRLSKKEAEARDARTKGTSEAVSNMKLLKLQGWEGYFEDGIQEHRKEELQRHVERGSFRALNQAISNAIPAIVLVVTLTAYRKTGNAILASKVFTAISLFNQLRFPLLFYPMVIDALANGKIALRRISSYLSQEDLTPYVQRIPEPVDGGGSIEMKNGNFLWASKSSSAAAPALCGVELSVKPGEVVAVIGEVGSGKTALIKALLGELEPVPRIVVDQSIGSSLQQQNSSSVLDIPLVSIVGNTSYCAQESWLSKGTLREAVIFGREYDEDRYLSALYDAGLDKDIVDYDKNGADSSSSNVQGSLTHDTQVGEGGSALSGGQRARVQIARALYAKDAGVFLLDDPLSALDPSVANTVFERVSATLRKRKSATIFVTNDLSLPRRCDKVVVVGKVKSTSSTQSSCSQILDIGTYDELISRGHDPQSMSVHEANDLGVQKEEVTVVVNEKQAISTHQDTVIIVKNTTQYKLQLNDTEGIMRHAEPDFMEHKTEFVPAVTEEVRHSNEHQEPLDSVKKVESNNDTSSIASGVASANGDSIKDASKKIATIDDTMDKGAVPISTYVGYLKAVKKPMWIAAALACFFMVNGAQFFQQYVVAKWTEVGSDSVASAKYLRSLVNAAGVVSIFLWLRSYLLMRVGVRASESIHGRMLSSIFRAPISFFDATPSGQILSRFGKEMETVDRAVPDGIGSVLFCYIQIFITAAGLAGVVTPAMAVPLAAMSVFYIKTMGRFRPAARDLKRCESKSRSPIYTHFSEALRGVETIRSFAKSSTTWSMKNRKLIDDNLSVFYSVKALDRWLSIRLESLGNMVVLAAVLASIILTRKGTLMPGSAAWGITQALSITGLLTWAVRVLTDLESHMLSVMRVSELMAPTIPQENDKVAGSIGATISSLPAAPDASSALLASKWPWNGQVVFNNVSMRYNTGLPLVLKNVSIVVKPGETLGVVGRTGSGKSSLLLTLFRLMEIEGGGSIEIDGIDIRSVDLQSLRRSIAIIPQDPVLFSGTVIYNLDATGQTSPADAWTALEAASPDLTRQFRSSGLGLNTMITEGGKNLSLGQRQLLCLARALLRNCKILVLDEATASIDMATDAQVQATIRKEFVDKGVSVITVAHRLETVLKSDKIAVLGDGELIEYGKPNELLKRPKGNLRQMVDASKKSKSKGSMVKAIS